MISLIAWIIASLVSIVLIFFTEKLPGVQVSKSAWAILIIGLITLAWKLAIFGIAALIVWLLGCAVDEIACAIDRRNKEDEYEGPWDGTIFHICKVLIWIGGAGSIIYYLLLWAAGNWTWFAELPWIF